MAYVLMTLLLLTAVFLILLVLVQRGKGGGLAGAFGGMGGQSAFGTKAGDLFTRVTIVVASFWIVLCVLAVQYFGTGRDILDQDLGGDNRQESGFSVPPPAESTPEGDSQQSEPAPKKE